MAAAVTGPVLLAGDDGFSEEVSPFNLTVVHQPAVAVGATSAADVQAAVRFAAAHQLAVAVSSTGHGAAMAATEDAVMITTRRMTDVTIDPVAQTARVEAGVRWQQVVDEAAKAGLAPLPASSPTVGVVGYTLGGGLSVAMGRAKGWAADHVRTIDVVTADGELRRASADSETDLFWALRGGKTNFGVVTALEFALFPVEHLYAGSLFFAGGHTARVLRSYQEFTSQAPDEVTSSVALVRMPDRPTVPQFMRGKLSVNIRISYLGPEADGEQLIAPLRAAAPAVLDTVTTRPYAEFAQISPAPTDPLAMVEHFALLNEFSPATVDAIIEAAGPEADTRLSIIDIRQLGGSLGRPAMDNAIDSHGAAFVIFTLTIVPPGEAATMRSSGLELMEKLQPWLNDQKHPNFLSPADATVDQTQKAYARPVYERLRDIKAEYDPGNMFRFNHNIPPRHRQH